jgi:uncharacterized membrane protein
MEHNNQDQNNGEFRIDIIKIAAIAIMFLLSVVMLYCCIIATLMLLSFSAFDFRFVILGGLCALFVLALTTFVFILRKVFSVKKEKYEEYIDIDFKRR